MFVFGNYAKKNVGRIAPLLNMLLRKVIQHSDTHFFPDRCRKNFDGAAVVCWAKPLFRVQTDADLLFHIITSSTSYADFLVFTTENSCAKIFLLHEREG